jgi:signal transduction histidine kinase
MNFQQSLTTGSSADNWSSPYKRATPSVLTSSMATTDSFTLPLLQTMVSSKNAQAALSGLCQILTDSLSADYCYIGVVDGFQTTTKLSSYGVFENSETRINSETRTFQKLLNVPEILEKMLTNEICQIGNLGRFIPVGEDVLSDHCTPGIEQSSQRNSQQTLQAKLPFHSLLATQLHLYSDCKGLVILGRSQPEQWRDQDMQTLHKLSAQIAMAASAAHLEQKVQRQMQYQRVVDDLVSAIRNAWDLEQVFRLAVNGSLVALSSSRGSLVQFKSTFPFHKQNKFEWLVRANAHVEYDTWQAEQHPETTGYPQMEFPANRLRFSMSQCALLQHLCLENTATLAIANLNQEISSTDVAPLFNPKRLPAVLVVPLEHQDTVLGCLVFQDQTVRSWSSEEIAFIQLVATQVSTAIIQHRTLRQVQSLVDERTAQLERSLVVQAKLYEKTRQQVEQLRNLNKRQDEFLSTVSHELLTPLTSMALAIRMLRQPNLPSERQQKYLDILEQQCLQETSLINDLLALQNLETGKVQTQYQPIDARYLVQNVAQSFEEQWSQRGLKLAIALPERAVNLKTDLESLNRILVELLTNAGKYSHPGTTIHLNLAQALDQQQNPVILTCRNQGAPIRPEEMPHIFERFSRGEGVTQQAIPGTGLGLALVKGLVVHLGGQIQATSQPTNSAAWETCFTVTLPQCPEQLTAA